MRAAAVVSLLLLCLAASGQDASAQVPAPAAPVTKTFASASDVAALVAKAKSERKDQPLILQSLLKLAPYDVNVEYRASVGGASLHEKEAELFYVIDGAGTMVTGGKLVGEQRQNPTNLTGTAIEGGASQPIAKGDVVMVPENTPHWVSSINGVLVLMSFHVPRPYTTP